MSYYEGFPGYISAAEKRKKAQESVEKLKKKNPDISPVIITGRKIAKTWWGKAWNDNLESYSDYSNRIGRGRSYVRNGAVLDIKIVEGHITALVQGSRSKPYNVNVTIDPLPKTVWEEIVKDCMGKIESLQELLEGKFPKALSELFTAKGKGLFPAPKEITLACSCPDWANMCKHVAAVLYGVGAKLDERPALFFVLRNINMEDIISETIKQKSQTLLEKSKTKSRRMIDETDISSVFGIDIETETKADVEENQKVTKK
ncbi:MAG: SWIM zinc finger family protein [Bacillota bacterium]